jgi:hypothetical protein
MTPTSDRQAIIDAALASFGYEIDGIALIEEWGGYALVGNGGFMLFVHAGDNAYKVTAGFEEESRGANAIAEMNEGYAWLFQNTDAQRTIARVAADDLAVQALTPHIHGALLIDEGETKNGEITRERWEVALGGGG